MWLPPGPKPHKHGPTPSPSHTWVYPVGEHTAALRGPREAGGDPVPPRRGLTGKEGGAPRSASVKGCTGDEGHQGRVGPLPGEGDIRKELLLERPLKPSYNLVDSSLPPPSTS